MMIAAWRLYPPPPKVPKVFKTKAKVRTFRTWSGGLNRKARRLPDFYFPDLRIAAVSSAGYGGHGVLLEERLAELDIAEGLGAART